MAVLELPPDAPALAHAAADIVLILHITSGGVAMVAGAVALIARKGEAMHRSAGTVFFLAMLLTAAIGGAVAPFLHEGQRPNTVAGLLTFYLVLTAWTTVRRSETAGAGRYAVLGFAVALGAAIAGVLFAMEAQASPTGTIDNSPPQAFLFFMIVGSFAAAGDLNVILRGGISGPARIARHLWRMCVGLFIAAGSFFLGQQQVFPAELRGSVWLFVVTFAPLIVMIFWMIRVRLTNWYSRAAQVQ